MGKKEKVKNIFNDIAGSYDGLNGILSLNIDTLWRKRMMKTICSGNKGDLLDVACGTGDSAIAAWKSGVSRIVGVDLSENMLEVGRKKIRRMGLDGRISLVNGDCESLTFEDGRFDAVSSVFGIRNFENPRKGLSEMFRVMKNGGQVLILEFSTPVKFPVKQLYRFYFFNMLPLIGRWISGNRHAYEYLPASVANFPQGEDFLAMMRDAGFTRLEIRPYTMGIATLYSGYKSSF